MYTLPKLNYSYGALEPYIEGQIMELHHVKHHQAYVNGLNTALEKYPELFKKTLIELLQNISGLPKDIQTAVRNHGGGVLNHTDFFSILNPAGAGNPEGHLAEAIKKQFQSIEQFQDLFNTAAKSCFGSGWAWLCFDKNGRLKVTATQNQDTPYSDQMTPIFGLDVWEHAYYLQYFNRRVDYIKAWWNVIDWKEAENRYQKIIG